MAGKKKKAQESMVEVSNEIVELDDEFDNDMFEDIPDIPDNPEDIREEEPMDEATIERFNERLKSLLKVAKKK